MEEVVHLAETLSEMLVSTAVDAYNLTIEVILSALPALCLQCLAGGHETDR